MKFEIKPLVPKPLNLQYLTVAKLTIFNLDVISIVIGRLGVDGQNFRDFVILNAIESSHTYCRRASIKNSLYNVSGPVW